MSNMSKYIGPSNYNNSEAILDTKNFYDPAVAEFHDNAYADIGTGAGAALAGPAGAVAGNLLGTGLSYLIGQSNAKTQMQNQKKLQEHQMQLNAQAQFMAPQMQKLGMEAAGLNAGGGNYTQATPAVGAGAAGMPQMPNLSNVFDGVTEMINAIKAPTEIEKTVAETGLAEAKTDETEATTKDLIPAQTKNFIENANKNIEETRNIKNNNDWMEAQNKFLKEQAPAIVEHRIGQLKASGQWDNLPPNTKETLESWAEGHFKDDIGIGALEGLNKVIDTQTKLSDADREILSNTKQMIIDFKQISDGKIMDAFSKLPVNQQNLMRSQITEYYAMANQAKTQADLNKLNDWLQKHNSDQWLLEHGMTDEIERKKWAELFNQFLHFPEYVGRGIGTAVPVIMTKGASAGGKTTSGPGNPNFGHYFN